MVNLLVYENITESRTTKKYSSEPHKIIQVINKSKNQKSKKYNLYNFILK